MTPPLRHPRAPLGLLVLGFLASRLAYRLAGVQFDASPLTYFWQYLDPQLLGTDLLRSVAYHHAQPPLFNLYLGAALKLSAALSVDPATVLGLGHAGFGLLLTLALHGLLRTLGLRRWPAALVALGLGASPTAVLYENWLFYTYPVAALLAAAALALHRLVRRGFRARDALLLFSLLAAIVLTRSLFHLAWWLLVAAALGALVTTSGEQRRALLRGAAVPLALVLAVHAKNLWLFGTFSTSSWLGMSLARVAVEPWPGEVRRDLVAAGELDEVSLVAPFSPLAHYPPALQLWGATEGPAVRDTRHPALVDAHKSTGADNYNHLSFLEISRRYRRDALHLLASAPGPYLGRVRDGWLFFCVPPSVYWSLNDNYARIEGLDDAWNTLLYGVLPRRMADRLFDDPETVEPERRHRVRALRHIGWLGVGLGLWAVARGLRRGLAELRSPTGDRALASLLLFLVGTILWVALVANSVEYLENNRFRMLVEPLVWCLVAWSVAELVRARRGGVSARS